MAAALDGRPDLEIVTTGAAALDRIVSVPWDVALLDPACGGSDDGALTLLRRLRTLAPDTVVIMWCAEPTVAFAVRAMRGDALDVLRKHAAPEEVRGTIERAVSHGALAREVRRLRGEVERARGLGDLVGESPLMLQLSALVERVANSDATVLIVGESGTGKELLARTIHRIGPRSEGPFVAFDCSALAPSLLEDELFGHEKGAFTGAHRARRGLFREAHSGTIFLDEIGDIDASVQNKLLRVLQEREIKPVGGERPVPVDVRVIAATNKDLRALVARGVFREDLYWRLAVVPVQVPPLRERKDDIPRLTAHILARRRGAAKSFGGAQVRYPTQITAKALARLMTYAWPGNIRELENVLSRAAILCDGEVIRADDLDLVGLPGAPALPAPASRDRLELPSVELGVLGQGLGLKQLVEQSTRQVEQAAIRWALEEEKSPAAAARRLGISRAGIYSKMKEYGIAIDPAKESP
ncbi:MAG: sigma-54-dependent Fis family transcriptional regulator [Myxococcales bacterium]|nr:sigma-54-dependent Fis family transcriptional regulator [Myxococcales bacterium]